MKRLQPILTLAVALALPSTATAVPQPPHDAATRGIQCADCHIPYSGVNAPAEVEGTATAGSTTTVLRDATKSWTADRWVGGVVTFLDGANANQFRTITASGADQVSWDKPLPHAPAPGDAYRIGKTTQDDVATKCRACHNPTGMASESADVALHDPSGSTIVGCGKCHDPHNLEPNSGWTGDASGTGYALVRQKVRWPTARAATVFPSPAPTPHTTGAPGFNGICETCHTATSYHRNNAAADHGHNATTTCTDCHKHVDGFRGGDCLSCHAMPQDDGNGLPVGGRRATSLEMPAGDVHAHRGATLDSGSCTVCHDQATHMDGYVDLVDPDNAAVTFRFVRWTDLDVDPDVSTFCTRCHDADGATRMAAPFDPFGGGNVPPSVAEAFQGSLRWNEAYSDYCFGAGGTGRPVNSHHDLSTGDQAWSGAKIECLSCHGAHSAAAGTPVVDPYAPTEAWTGTTSAFCMTCHDGGNGPTDPDFPPGVQGPTVALRGLENCAYAPAPWWSEYTWTNSPHGPGSKRAWPRYSGAPAADIDCTVCHDAHGSYSPANLAGNPYALRDWMDGTAFVDDGSRTGGWLGAPWNTYGRGLEVKVTASGTTVGWGAFCSGCHGGWQQAYEWHAYCNACQNCHGHGQTFGDSYDWGSGGTYDQPCPGL